MLIKSLRWRQREPSIHEEHSPPQAARVAVKRPSSWRIAAIILADRVITNKKIGAPAFGYPAKDQRKLAAESTVYEHARAK
jgi:hypothetical protein